MTKSSGRKLTVLVRSFRAYNMHAAVDGTSPTLLAAAQACCQGHCQYNPHCVFSHEFYSPFSKGGTQDDSMIPSPLRMAKDKMVRPSIRSQFCKNE
jgi:hypothetical protein